MTKSAAEGWQFYSPNNDMASDVATLYDIGVAGMAKPKAGLKGYHVGTGAKWGEKGRRVGAGANPGEERRRQKKRATR